MNTANIVDFEQVLQGTEDLDSDILKKIDIEIKRLSHIAKIPRPRLKISSRKDPAGSADISTYTIHLTQGLFQQKEDVWMIVLANEVENLEKYMHYHRRKRMMLASIFLFPLIISPYIAIDDPILQSTFSVFFTFILICTLAFNMRAQIQQKNKQRSLCQRAGHSIARTQYVLSLITKS